MSEPEQHPHRPWHTTMALSVVMMSALFAVVTAWETMANLHSLDTSELLRDLLDEPGWSGTGLTLDGARDMLRVSALVTGAGAAAAGLLAAWSFTGDRTTRMMLGVVAVPVVITGFLAGGFASTMLGVATLMLWLQPSRAWFNGEPLPEMRPLARASARPAGSPRSTSAPAQGWAAPDPSTRLSVPTRPPMSVVRAVILTHVFSAGALVVLVLAMVLLATDPDAVLDDLRRQEPSALDQGFSEGQLVTVFLVMIGGLIVWCLLALALSWLTVRRKEWARICLILSSVGAGAMFLVSALANPLMLLGVLACVICVRQLSRPESQRWTTGR